MSRAPLARAVSGLGVIACALAAVLALVLLSTFLRTEAAGMALRLGTAALFVLAWFSPGRALLLLAAVSPLSTTLTSLAGVSLSGTALAEAMVLATIAPWLLRQTWNRSLLPPAVSRVAPAALLLALLAVTSCVVHLSVVSLQIGGRDVLVAALADFVLHGYFDRSTILAVVAVTATLLEGLALMVMAAACCGHERLLRVHVPLMMLAGAAAAAVLNATLLVSAALRSGNMLERLRELWLFTRISRHYDRNAAGSVFAMMALAGAGLFGGTPLRRVAVALGVPLVLVGLWLTGSRTAMAGMIVGAIVFAAAIGLQYEYPRHRRRASLVAAGLVLGAGVAFMLYPAERNPDIEGSVTGRRELAIAALRMFASAPAFGVGIGQFYDRSDDFGRPQLPSVLPPGATQENAHNNFLQVLAELGLAGFCALLWLLGAAMAPAVRAIQRGRDVPITAGITAGLIAYLFTWLTGHPLLVPEALYPFFLLLGVSAATGGPAQAAAPAPRRAASLVAMAAVVLAALLPMRALAAMRDAELEHVGYGVSGWQDDPVVDLYRWAGTDAAVFVPANAAVVEIPLRRPPGSGPIEIDLSLDGRPADRVRLVDDAWRFVRIVLPPSDQRYRRVDLDTRNRVPGAERVLMVGKVRLPLGDAAGVPIAPRPISRRSIAGDFDGDGKADSLVYRPATATWTLLGGSFTFGEPGDRAVPADYDGDGKADVATFRPASGTWHVRGRDPVQFGDRDDIPVPGDYNGDGITDVAVYRPSTGTWYVKDLFAIGWGDRGDVPMPGDYDGDGRTDLAVFRPSDGTWHVRDQFELQFGDPGDIPVPADYDGDGTLDAAVFRPRTGTWHIRDHTIVPYGMFGDVPVPGDYDGDGKADIAVYRPASGEWWVRNQDRGDLWRRVAGWFGRGSN